MERVLIAVFVIAIVGAIPLLVWYFSAEQVTKRRLRAAPRRKIAEVVDGEIVKIVGRIELAAPPLIAPLSGRQCAYYDAVVDEQVRSGKRKKWVTRIREIDARAFVVVDDTGRALVCSAPWSAVIVKDHHQSSGFLNDATPDLEAYLARHGYTSNTLLGFNRTMRYLEGVLEPGEEVAVLGRARWEIDPSPRDEDRGYRGGAKRLVIGPADSEFIVSDDTSTT